MSNNKTLLMVVMVALILVGITLVPMAKAEAADPAVLKELNEKERILLEIYTMAWAKRFDELMKMNRDARVHGASEVFAHTLVCSRKADKADRMTCINIYRDAYKAECAKLDKLGASITNICEKAAVEAIQKYMKTTDKGGKQ